jgi:hypothetical protein
VWSIKILYYSKTIIWLFFWLVFPWPKNQFLAQGPTVQSNPAAMVPTGSNGGTHMLWFFSSSADLMTQSLHSFMVQWAYFGNCSIMDFLILQDMEKTKPM